MEEAIRYYHFCQHPETLSMDNLKSRGLYLSHDENNWSSPHLKDVVSYLVTLKPDVKLKKIYSECDFEQLDREELILQYMTEGYDGIEHRVGLKDTAPFVNGGVYEAFEYIEPPKKKPLGDSDNDQIFLFRALGVVEDIVLSHPSKFQLAEEFIEVRLPRKVLPSIEESSIADVRDSHACRSLLRDYAPRGHYLSCWYELNERSIKLRYIPRPPLQIETIVMADEEGLAKFVEKLAKAISLPR